MSVLASRITDQFGHICGVHFHTLGHSIWTVHEDGCDFDTQGRVCTCGAIEPPPSHRQYIASLRNIRVRTRTISQDRDIRDGVLTFANQNGERVQ